MKKYIVALGASVAVLTLVHGTASVLRGQSFNPFSDWYDTYDEYLEMYYDGTLPVDDTSSDSDDYYDSYNDTSYGYDDVFENEGPYVYIEVWDGEGDIEYYTSNMNTSATCSSSDSCEEELEAGDFVRLTAQPYEGYDFAEWGGDECRCAGDTRPTCLHTVTEDSYQYCAAYFIPNEDFNDFEEIDFEDGSSSSSDSSNPFAVTLDVDISGDGFVDYRKANPTEDGECTDSCSFDFEQASYVRFIAKPGELSRFVEWSGDNCPCTENADSDGCLFTTDQQNIQCEALFEELATATLIPNENGRILYSQNNEAIEGFCENECTLPLKKNETIQLTAQPDLGYRFVEWRRRGCICVNEERPTCNRPENGISFECEAVFEEDPYDPSLEDETYDFSVEVNTSVYINDAKQTQLMDGIISGSVGGQNFTCVVENGDASGDCTFADVPYDTPVTFSIDTPVGLELKGWDTTAGSEFECPCAGSVMSTCSFYIQEDVECTGFTQRDDFVNLVYYGYKRDEEAQGQMSLTVDDETYFCDLNTSCEISVKKGAEVTIEALPAEGSEYTGKFFDFNSAYAAQCPCDGEDGPTCSFTVDSRVECNLSFISRQSTEETGDSGGDFDVDENEDLDTDDVSPASNWSMNGLIDFILGNVPDVGVFINRLIMRSNELDDPSQNSDDIEFINSVEPDDTPDSNYTFSPDPDLMFSDDELEELIEEPEPILQTYALVFSMNLDDDVKKWPVSFGKITGSAGPLAIDCRSTGAANGEYARGVTGAGACGSNSVAEGTQVRVSLDMSAMHPAGSMYFERWSAGAGSAFNCPCEGSTSTTCSFELGEDVQCTAFLKAYDKLPVSATSSYTANQDFTAKQAQVQLTVGGAGEKGSVTFCDIGETCTVNVQKGAYVQTTAKVNGREYRGAKYVDLDPANNILCACEYGSEDSCTTFVRSDLFVYGCKVEF